MKNLGVNHRCIDVAMLQQLLDGSNIRAAFEKGVWQKNAGTCGTWPGYSGGAHKILIRNIILLQAPLHRPSAIEELMSISPRPNDYLVPWEVFHEISWAGASEQRHVRPDG